MTENDWNISKMIENYRKLNKHIENDGKWWEMMGNVGKWWEMVGNDGKWEEIEERGKVNAVEFRRRQPGNTAGGGFFGIWAFHDGGGPGEEKGSVNQ